MGGAVNLEVGMRVRVGLVGEAVLSRWLAPLFE